MVSTCDSSASALDKWQANCVTSYNDESLPVEDRLGYPLYFTDASTTQSLFA